MLCRSLVTEMMKPVRQCNSTMERQPQDSFTKILYNHAENTGLSHPQLHNIYGAHIHRRLTRAAYAMIVMQRQQAHTCGCFSPGLLLRALS